jgi:hypothetical protein
MKSQIEPSQEEERAVTTWPRLQQNADEKQENEGI